MGVLSRKTAAIVSLGVTLLASGFVATRAAEPELSVGDHGTGTEVVDRKLEDRRASFTEGERVAFWTLVLGGGPDDRIQHVWIREGEDKLTIGLAVNSSHWRTWSFKTLFPGSAGAWAVEARDLEGRVLARDEFTCVAASGG